MLPKLTISTVKSFLRRYNILNPFFPQNSLKMSSNISEEDATSARASSAGADEVYHPGSRYEAEVKENGRARRPVKSQMRAKPEEGRVPGTNKHYKHYDHGTNASEVYMEFPDGGRKEVIPRPEKRVYKDIELAPIDSGDTLLGSSGDQAKPGLEELQLLRDLYNSANQQSLDSGDPANQESDGVDGGPVAEALNHVPFSGDYSLTDESESDESEVEAVQTKKAKGRPARKPTGKGRAKSTAPTQNGDDDQADSDDDGGDNKVGEHNRLDVTTHPLSDIDRIFSLITDHAVNEGLLEAMKVFGDQGIKVVTMCSGTEAPFVALDLIRKSLRSSDAREKFKYQHLGSAEIEPWKQAFILRNFRPPIIFRDVTDFESHAENPDDKDRYPVTAFGKRVEPPRGAHILVAGSSCVDYSTLNKIKGEWKGERGEGESAKTMNGIGAYAKMYKPTVIIIENVAGAPWNMIKVFWAEKGYDTVIVKLSTVDYYLPQTRQRGYLFGVHQDIADLAGFDINQAHKEWIHLMAGFQRRASSPYSDFTLREDDPRLQSVIHSVTDNKKRGGSTDWVQCRKRHVQERVANKLGLGTPFTKRRGHPQAQLDDYADQEWALKQSKRVLDMLDIRHLDDVSRRDYDMRFKHRNINVSQNVDRDRDNRQWGIVGCVTPSGCLFDTRRGGPLTGLEILALQGFPTGDLQLDKYTSNQLQDLAGNAMSTTVIGPAILSAIIACFRVHEDNDGEQQIFEVTVDEHQDSSEDQPMEDAPLREAFDERALETDPNSKDLVPLEEEFPHVHDTEKGPYSLATIVGKATELQPLCRCEGLHRRTSEDIIYCQDCYYTCCKGCSRDTHGHKALRKLEIGTSPRPVASTFAQFLIEVLPAVLQNQNASSLLPPFDASTSEEIKVRVSEALESKVHFQGVKFEGSWKAVYESELALLELEFVPNRHMCDTCENHEKPHLHLDVVPMWLLFAKAPADEPVESKMRKLFQHPIASMTPEQTLFSGNWKLWDGPPQQSKVRIVRAGEQVPSWERRLELEGAPFRSLNSFSAIEVSHSTSANDKAQSSIEDIAGIYQLLPDCPAPSGTLHRRVRGSGTGTAPLFLFLQSNPLQDGRFDRVVFSNAPFRPTTVDGRGVLAALDKSWRPVATAQVYRGQEVLCEPISQWSDSPAQKLQIPKEENTVQKWVLKPNADPMSAAACVNAFSTILLLDLTCDANAKGRLENRREICITLERKTHALSEFGWILSHSANIPRPWNSWQHIELSNAVECKVCSPAQPCVKWVLKKTGASENVKAMESPLEAAEYENALSGRPNPAVALLRDVQGKALLDVKINITTLAHRAVAPFLVNRSPDSELESLQWRVDPYDQFGPHPKFSLPKLQSNKLDPVKKSLQQELDLGRPLWKSQLQVLAWMIDQETSPKVWDEMSLIESCLPALGWRLEAKALLRRRHVRGGVIADEVGAGKTTTSLALVKYDYQQSQTTAATQSQGTPDSEPEAQPNQDDAESHTGKLETDATLILVPKNILSQWEGEVRNCLNWRKLQPAERTGLEQKAPYYITVKDVPELQKYSHEQIKGAALVLAAWDLFGQKAYWSTLRKIACSTCTPDEPGRAFDEWLRETLPSLGTCVEALKTGVADFWTAWDSVRERAQTDHKYENFEGFLTRQTKRNFFAKERAAAKNKAGPSNATAGNEASEDKKAMDLRIQETAQEKSQEELAGFRRDLHRQGQPMPPPVLLHMFAFRRLIVDEYTYIEGETLLALLQLDAARRWMLSGTPSIQAYDSLNTTAKLIGTQIATYDEHEGKFGFGKDAPKMSKDKSHAQEVQSYEYVASAAFKEAVYGCARDFSERFIRKNEPSQGRAGKTSSLARVDLNPSEWVTCSDVGNLVMDPDRPFGKSTSTKKVGVDREVPASIWWLTDLVERTNGPQDARICSSVMLEEIWPVVREDAHCILSRQLAGAEEHRMEQIIKEQAGHVCSRISEVLPLLQELWHMHRLVRHSDKGAAASFTGLRANVSGGRLADMNAVAIVESLLGYARDNEVVPALLLSKTKKNPAAAGRVNLPWDAAEMGSAAVAVKEFDLRMARVENHLEILMQGLRRLRLLKAVFGAFQKRMGDCSRCGAAAAWEAASISTACGHVVCGECASEACCAAGDEADVVPASRFAVDYVGAQVPGTVTCSRLRLAVSLVHEAIAARDSVLVFAQHQGIKNAFTEACGEAGIACLDGFEAGTAARAVERFRAAQPACLVLKVDSADAAGWNLQSANHVVFLSVPVLGSVAELDATREQAVGRCWRPGQTKQVFVYQVAATETGELDLVA
jgi:site-specific DNA-cytosine methylase